MPGIRTSAITYRRGISNSTPNFFLIAQANYVIPQPTSRFRQPVPTPAAAPVTPVTPYAPTPDTTILVYSQDQGDIITWGPVLFTRDTNLPGFCYTAITTALPASTVPLTQIGSITIGNIVTSIGANAFFGCINLESLTFTPTSILTSIGDLAFKNCFNLTSVSIPASVTSIGANTFSGCTALKNVTVSSNASNVSSTAFTGCSNVNLVISSETNTVVENFMRNVTGVSSVTISSGITTVGKNAFKGCKDLKTIIYA